MDEAVRRGGGRRGPVFADAKQATALQGEQRGACRRPRRRIIAVLQRLELAHRFAALSGTDGLSLAAAGPGSIQPAGIWLGITTGRMM